MRFLRRRYVRITVITIVALLVVTVVIAVVLSFVAGIFSHRSIHASARDLLEDGFRDAPAKTVTEADLAGLPEPVQRWLRASNVVGSEMTRTVRLRQEGRFRQSEGGMWMSFEAVEYYSVNPPGFIWRARFRFAGVTYLEVRDSYLEGRGETSVRPLSLFTAGADRGPEVDQGDLLRFLNETMWFPSAALSDYIEWTPVDESSATATMNYRGVTASAVFVFDGQSRLTNMIANRYGKFGGEFVMETWTTPLDAHGEFSGVAVPTEGTGVWLLDSGDFEYIDLEITEIEYNVDSPF